MSKLWLNIIRLIMIAVILAPAALGLMNPFSAHATIIDNIGGQARNFNDNNKLGLPDSGGDPIPLIAKIITYLLGFLGIVFLLLIIYAGVYWMTAMGDTNKVSKAKKIIGTASMGIVVIVLALAIVQFVLLVLGQAFSS